MHLCISKISFVLLSWHEMDLCWSCKKTATLPQLRSNSIEKNRQLRSWSCPSLFHRLTHTQFRYTICTINTKQMEFYGNDEGNDESYDNDKRDGAGGC